MKKVLFVTLAMAVAMTGFAQKALVKKDAYKNATVTMEKRSDFRVSDGSAAQGVQFAMPEHMVQNRDYTDFLTMTTNYDLQSNSALGNRIAVWPDGSAAFTATWDYSGDDSYPDRGTGYNFYNSETGDIYAEPVERQEPIKTGWPSITPCGNGELLASHGGSPTSTHVYYRPTRGEGEWTELAVLENVQWPRIICSGPNDQYVHVIGAHQEGNSSIGYTNFLHYVRSTDGGQTWSEIMDMPLVDNTAEGEYKNSFSADDYVMAANGNDVAILLGSYTTDLFYIISHDNGETWEKQIVLGFPEEDAHVYDWEAHPSGMLSPFITSDNSHAIAIDENGVVHVAFGMFRWKPTDDSHYTYWPAYNYGIVYWNSNFTNEEGGHEIPPFGTWSGDAAFPEYNDSINYTMDIDRFDALCHAYGLTNLNYFGYIDEDGDGEISYENVIGATWHYRSFGLATLPGLSVDKEGNVAIIYSVWSETRVSTATNFSYRSAYVSLRDSGGTWYDDVINLCDDFMYQYTEAYSTVASPRAYDGQFWVMFSGDEAQGLYLDKSDDYPSSNGGQLTDNELHAFLIIPDKDMPGLETWGVQHNEAINPMTAVRVYPNPATDVLNIEVNASQSSAMSINVFNIMGQKVMESNVNINAGMNTPTINTADFASGIYFVTVKANGFENTMKFIVK